MDAVDRVLSVNGHDNSEESKAAKMSCATPDSNHISAGTTTALKTYRNKRKYPSENVWDTLTKNRPPSNVTTPSPRAPLASTPQPSSAPAPRRFFLSKGTNQDGIATNHFYGTNAKSQTMSDAIAKRPRPPRLSEPLTARRGLLRELESHPGAHKEAKPVEEEVAVAAIAKPPPVVKSEEIGFPNLGLTCYLNSVLQALLGLSSFVHPLNIFHANVKELAAQSCLSEEVFNRTLIHTFTRLSVLKQRGSQHLIGQAIERITRVEKISGLLKSVRMQDAHDFLLQFFAAINEETDFILALSASETTVRSPIVEIFEHETEERKLCLKCEKETVQSTKEFILYLQNTGCEDAPSDPPESASTSASTSPLKPLPSGDVAPTSTSLQEIIEQTLCASIQKLCCDTCAGRDRGLFEVEASPEATPEATPEDHSVGVAFRRLPNVLFLFLPRVTSLGPNTTVKLTNPVTVNEYLHLKKVTSSAVPESELDYRISSIVCHIGSSPSSGHYIAFVRSDDNAWFRYDDSLVTSISFSAVAQTASTNGYLFLYTKSSSHENTGAQN